MCNYSLKLDYEQKRAEFASKVVKNQLGFKLIFIIFSQKLLITFILMYWRSLLKMRYEAQIEILFGSLQAKYGLKYISVLRIYFVRTSSLFFESPFYSEEKIVRIRVFSKFQMKTGS